MSECEVSFEKEEKKTGNTKKKIVIAILVLAIVAVVALGVNIFLVGEVTTEEVEQVTTGMTTSEIVDVFGKENKQEDIDFDGKKAKMYTWPADLGEGEYTVSVIFVNDKAERIIQSTLEE